MLMPYMMHAQGQYQQNKIVASYSIITLPCLLVSSVLKIYTSPPLTSTGGALIHCSEGGQLLKKLITSFGIKADSFSRLH